MRNSKLCEHLLLLDQRGRKRFHDFLNSPYFRAKEDARTLFEVLDQYLLRYANRNLSEEECHAKVFPNKAFNANQFRKLKSRLLGHFLEFIAAEDSRNRPLESSLAVLRFFQEKGEDRFFEGQCKAVMSDLKAIAWQDDAYHNSRVELETLRWKMEVNSGHHDSKNTLKRQAQVLRAQIDFKWIRHFLIHLSRARIYAHQTDSDQQFLEEFIRDAGQRLDQTSTTFQIYFHLCMSLKEPDETRHFFSFRDLLLENLESVPPTEQLDLLTGGLNYCIGKINEGKAEFREVMFELYQQLIDKGLAHSQGSAAFAGHFKNAVSLAARLNKFDWAEKFIESESRYLPEENHEEILNFNRGILAFFKGAYEQSERLLNRAMAGMDDIFYSLDIRFYLLRIHYQTGNQIGMESLAHAFRIYLLRHTSITESRRQRYLEFLKLFRRLYQTPPYAKEKMMRLKEDIADSTRHSGTEWLLEKVEEMLETK